MKKRLATIGGYFSKRQYVFMDEHGAGEVACASGFEPFLPEYLQDSNYWWTPRVLRGKAATILIGETEGQLQRLVPGCFTIRSYAQTGIGLVCGHLLFKAGFQAGEKVTWTLVRRRSRAERCQMAEAKGGFTSYEDIPLYTPFKLSEATSFVRDSD